MLNLRCSPHSTYKWFGHLWRRAGSVPEGVNNVISLSPNGKPSSGSWSPSNPTPGELSHRHWDGFLAFHIIWRHRFIFCPPCHSRDIHFSRHTEVSINKGSSNLTFLLISLPSQHQATGFAQSCAEDMREGRGDLGPSCHSRTSSVSVQVAHM